MAPQGPACTATHTLPNGRTAKCFYLENWHTESPEIRHMGYTEDNDFVTWLSEPPPEPPQTWDLPPEPGPEVTKVRCKCHGTRWRLRYAAPVGAWEQIREIPVPESDLMPWRNLIIMHGPVIDATNEGIDD